MRDCPGLLRDLACIDSSSYLLPDILSCVNLGALAALSKEMEA